MKLSDKYELQTTDTGRTMWFPKNWHRVKKKLFNVDVCSWCGYLWEYHQNGTGSCPIADANMVRSFHAYNRFRP